MCVMKLPRMLSKKFQMSSPLSIGSAAGSDDGREATEFDRWLTEPGEFGE